MKQKSELDEHYSMAEDTELLDCFLNLPDLEEPGNNPLNYKHIHERQQTCTRLSKTRDRFPTQYADKELDAGVKITCHVNPADPDNDWKIALPDDMVEETVHWFHA